MCVCVFVFVFMCVCVCFCFLLFRQVALFKSMAAAADWGNSLRITSGSFQVAEVAPAMRNAFEKEVCTINMYVPRMRHVEL